MSVKLTLAALAAVCCAGVARSEPIGDVDTVFKLIGPDHKIVVDAYDDPKVAGVTCYVSRAKTGGISGALGLAEDKAEASIACRQIGPVCRQAMEASDLSSARPNPPLMPPVLARDT